MKIDHVIGRLLTLPTPPHCPSMATEISLNCCILGLDKLKTFSVDIAPSKNVYHLKRNIKKEKQIALNYIDADQLDIWKVNDPVQRTYHY